MEGGRGGGRGRDREREMRDRGKESERGRESEKRGKSKRGQNTKYNFLTSKIEEPKERELLSFYEKQHGEGGTYQSSVTRRLKMGAVSLN